MDKVLFVDDEERLLAGIRRNLRREFDVHIAVSGAAGLAQIAVNGPFAVIVSDMQMPEMNGVEFLTKAKLQSPDSIRIMLTGNADQQTAVDAINTGDVHQFLTKPCEAEKMIQVLHEAAEAYRLKHIEKDLLERTFQASVEVLVQVMSIANPAAFGRSTRLADLALQVADGLGVDETWPVRSAALLSQLGCINLPESLINAVATGKPVTDEDWAQYTSQASHAAELIDRIPRLDSVAAGIRYQYKNFDGSGVPEDAITGQQIPMTARILRAVLAADSLLSGGKSAEQVITWLHQDPHLYDPKVIEALIAVLSKEDTAEIFRIHVTKLLPTMVLAEDVLDKNGVLLVCRGSATSESVIKHLARAAENGQIQAEVLASMA